MTRDTDEGEICPASAPGAPEPHRYSDAVDGSLICLKCGRHVAASLRGTVKVLEVNAGADAFMKECIEITLRHDPTAHELDPGLLVQASVSLAVQRLLNWAQRKAEGTADPDRVTTQALVGLMTGLGLSIAIMDFEIEDVLDKADVIVRTACEDMRALQRMRRESN